MEREETYYEILGVSRSASFDEIRKSYKALAMKYHPDRLNGLDPREQERLTEKMKAVTNAYTTLKDEDLRKEYDQRLFMQQQYGASAQGRNPSSNQYYRPRYTYTYRSYRPRSGGGLFSALIFFGIIAGFLLIALSILSVIWPVLLVIFIISMIFRRR